MKDSIVIKNLQKHFGEVKAVDNISFRVNKGEFLAFLGVNGAGKSTTINIISGNLKMDSGEVTICGYDVVKDADKVKSHLGVVFQTSYLDKNLTVYDNLKIKAGLYGITGKAFLQRLEYLTTLLDFSELLNREYGKLSGGQKRKIDIARALLHSPDVLILDEPTAGLDPQSRMKVWQVLNDLRKNNGLTIFLTTHYMEEADEADNVIMIDKGKIVANDTPHNLKNKYTANFMRVYNSISTTLLEQLATEFGVTYKVVTAFGIDYRKETQYIEIVIPRPEVATQMIVAHPEAFTDFEVIKGRMDAVFLSVTGRNAKELN